MARGWESKAIESQQQDAETRKKPGREMSQAERGVATRRRTLELARARAVAERAAASTPAHRDMLSDAIAAIDERLRALDEQARD